MHASQSVYKAQLAGQGLPDHPAVGSLGTAPIGVLFINRDGMRFGHSRFVQKLAVFGSSNSGFGSLIMSQ